MPQPPLKIVLADDVRLQLEIETAFFKRRGFDVVAASSGEEAMAATFREMPKLVILDQVMPDLQGIEVCKRLKTHVLTRHIPVVVVSAHDTDEIRGACSRARAEAFVPKSAGREQLLEVVAGILKVPVRRAARLTVVFNVQAEGEEGRQSVGRAIDLSESGMGLEVNRAFEPPTVLDLRFRLHGDRDDVKLSARVRWSKPRGNDVYTIGLEFAEMPVLVRRRLNDYMDRAFSRQAS